MQVDDFLKKRRTSDDSILWGQPLEKKQRPEDPSIIKISKDMLNQPRYWTEPRKFSLEEVVAKEKKNAIKAVEEYKKTYPSEASFVEISQLNFDKKNTDPIFFDFSVEECELQGRRQTMEDVHFVINNEEHFLVGVFDGFNGDKVSRFASEYVQKNFFEILQKEKTVHAAFEVLFKNLETLTNESPEFNKIGSTAVISYIDKKNNPQVMETATLGDSTGFIYRNFADPIFKGQKELKSIPVSPIRNFKHSKDLIRLVYAKGSFEYSPKTEAKNIRSGFGINVSRALGRAIASHGDVSPKPKITRAVFEEGDILTWFTDGVTDNLNESKKIKTMQKALEEGQNVAKAIIDRAFETSLDNLTAVFVRVKKKQ